MGLLFAGAFTSVISAYRLLWIGGRFGGHKTALAYKLAETYLSSGYRLVSNNRSVWTDNIEEVNLLEDNTLRAVVILDEGGLEFKSSRQIEQIAAYARKMNVIYIIPSFFPPTRAAQVLICQPLFNFKSAGLPLVVYKWRAKLGAFSDQGIFFWWWPNEIYGIYSSSDPGDRATEIVNWLIEKKEQFRERLGYDESIPEMAETEESILMEAANTMAQAADDFSSIPVRRGRRKRF